MFNGVDIIMAGPEQRLMKKKICLIGDSRVGKTSLIKRFVSDEFDDKYIATIGAKISKKDLTVTIMDDAEHQVALTLTIWDLIGHRDREYWSLLKRYYLNTDGALFVCDLTSIATLTNLKEWISSLFNTIGVVPFLIMANKSDLASKAQFEEKDLIEFSKQYNSDFFYTSAKSGSNVNLSFSRLGEIMVGYSIRTENISDAKDVVREIISDYCVLHGGEERAMPIINYQFKQAGVNINSPTKQELIKVIQLLSEVTKSIKGENLAREERSKYLRLVHKLP
jgi:small GTP-binding protein